LSCTPPAFGGSSPPSCSRRPELSAYQPTRARSSIVLPLWYVVVVPARHAYSHSASVGRSTARPAIVPTFSQKPFASCHDTLCTGIDSPFVMLGLAPITASYCACVVSYLPM